MANTDPIADFLTRIRNAQKAKHQTVSIPSSKLKQTLAEILKKEGYIRNFEVSTSEDKAKKTLTLQLRYDSKGAAFIREISRISKPGNRKYVTCDDISTVRDVVTTTIISTSKGLMTDTDATQAKMGGELICRIS